MVSGGMTLGGKALCAAMILLLSNLLLHPVSAQMDTNETEVQSNQLAAFALEAGLQAADEDPDYTCTASNPCKLGCCGSV